MSFDHRKYHPFPALQRPQRRWPNRVLTCAPDYCAVDLRDGNQALVKPMSVEQKTRMFTLLCQLGFKEIEVGFPAASQPDFDFVRELVEKDLVPSDVTIQVLTQASEMLIRRTFEAVKGARRANMHLYNSTSVVQRRDVFGLDRSGIQAIAVRGATWVKECASTQPQTTWEFQYSPESFTGTELEFAIEVVNAVNDVWQPQRGQAVVINLPATVEMSTPNVYADMIEHMCEHMAHREHFRVSVHTHNDRGCGVAAAELGVLAGADRVEGTLLGNGERSGNMDLVTFAMNLYSQGIDPKLDLSRMREIIETVEYCTEIATHPRHAYAGELVFTAFSGSHQDAIRKCLVRHDADRAKGWEVAYLPIDPRDLGRRYEEVIRINSQSGKGGVLHVLERDLGITLPRWLQIEFSRVVQTLAEQQGGEVSPTSIHALFDATYVAVPDAWRLGEYDVRKTEDGVRTQITLGVTLGDGTRLTGRGRGMVAALADALATSLGVSITVGAFDEMALDAGTDARAMACLRAAVTCVNGAVEHSVGVAFAEDTSSAVLKALLAAAARVVGDTPRNAATRVDAPHPGTVGPNASSGPRRRPNSTSPRSG
jgi:2-isopropylmalate synthase